MSETQTYQFTDANNYTVPSTAQITGGKFSLKLLDNTGTLTEDFADDTGFTYDSDFVEFSGGLIQQKDTRSSNSTFYASYGSDINGDWGSGTLTGTAVNGASISGGKLDLAHNDVRYVNYNADGNADSQQTGCIRFRIIPNYSGAPSANKAFCTIGKQAGSLWNLIQIHQDSIGKIRIALYGDAGASIFDGVLDTWLPTAGITYEIEFNWDITTGASRLFVDGVQLGSTITNTGTRSSDINLFRVGSTYDAVDKSDFYIEDIIIFSTVQHIANYTPDWTDIYDTIYRETKADLPIHSYSGAGSIQAFTNFVTTDSNAQYIINDLYWTGSAWAVSDGSWSQSTTAANILANIASLTVSDTIDISVVFNDSNIIGNADNLVLTYTAQIYSTVNPTTITLEDFRADGITSFAATETKTGNDEIKYRLIKDDVKYYYNSAWEISDGTYSQANTATEINTNVDDFLTPGSGGDITLEIDLHSDDGSTTPELDLITIVYDIFGGAISDATLCLLYGWVRISNVPVENAVITISPTNNIATYNDSSIEILRNYSIVTNALGYFEKELIVTVNLDVKYNVKIHYQDLTTGELFDREYNDIVIPDQDSVNFAELI